MGLTTTAKVVIRADMYGQHQVIQPGNVKDVTQRRGLWVQKCGRVERD